MSCVSWDDAQAYVSWLSRISKKNYRLLSEAEWEYAARAGTTTSYHFGVSISSGQANFNSVNKRTVSVGLYARNRFGLHDMHGNVEEWVRDCWNKSYGGAPNDGSTWLQGVCRKRVFRGGSFGGEAPDLRSANRSNGKTTDRVSIIGLRVARTLPR